jgi:hypothetical protein
MFCASGLVFDSTVGVGSCFHCLRARTRFRRCRGRRFPFSCFARSGLIFSGVEGMGPIFIFLRSRTSFRRYRGVGSYCHVLRTRTHFRRYRGHRAPFSCFALSYSFSAVPSASGPVFMFCAQTHFRRYRGRRAPFSCFACPNSFRRCRARRVPFSWFTLPDSFSAVPRASGPIFNLCASELIFGGTEGVGSRFHVLRIRTHFRGYRGRLILFSCF